MSKILQAFFLFIVKLIMGLSAALIGIFLLFAALAFFTLRMVTAFLTGRKPAPFMAFSRFQQFPQPGMWNSHAKRQRSPKTATSQVVDVQVREIPVNGP